MTDERAVLNDAWVQRAELRAEADKLYVKADKLYAKGDELCAESNKLRAEGNRLWAGGDKLRAKGNKLWAEAVIAHHGNVMIEWKNWNEKARSYECHLGNGEVFK